METLQLHKNISGITENRIAEMLDQENFAREIEETLTLDPEESPEEIRAAAFALVSLARNDIWPVGVLIEYLSLALSKLEIIRELYAEDGFAMDDTVDRAILRLKLELSDNKFPG